MPIIVVSNHDIEAIDHELLLYHKSSVLWVEGVNISQQNYSVGHVVQFWSPGLVCSEGNELIDVGDVLDERLVCSLSAHPVVDAHKRLHDRFLQNFSII